MSLGSLIGLFFVPYIIDAFGRRSGILVGSLIMCLGVGLQAGATTFGMFVASRLLLGFGDCIVLGSAPLLITELAPPQDRAILATLGGASYHSGAFIASTSNPFIHAYDLKLLEMSLCLGVSEHHFAKCLTELSCTTK